MTRRYIMGRMGLLLAASSSAWAMLACTQTKLAVQPVPAGGEVLAFGDSLTQGLGAGASEAFPHLLAEQTGWNVVNAGVSGDTSAQALARLPRLLTQYQPALVIVGIGGNDFLRQQSAQAAQDNIETIVRACQEAHAQVLLVAMPEVNLLASAGWLKDHALYKAVANKLRVPLLEDAWSTVLSDERLRSDRVHANAQGYAQFTDLLVAQLRVVGLLAQ